MQDKRPYNKKGQKHGYWVTYFSTGEIWWLENYVNGKQCGLDEWYDVTGQVKQRLYFAR